MRPGEPFSSPGRPFSQLARLKVLWVVACQRSQQPRDFWSFFAGVASFVSSGMSAKQALRQSRSLRWNSDVTGGDRVVHPEAAPPSIDEPRAAEIRDVPRTPVSRRHDSPLKAAMISQAWNADAND